MANDTPPPLQHPGQTLRSMPGPTSILLIENDPLTAQALRMLLELEGFQLLIGISADELLAQLKNCPFQPDLIISDYRLSSTETGVQAIGRLQRVLGDGIPAMLLTGNTAIQPTDAGPLAYPVLYKPVDGDELLAFIRQITSREHSST